MLEDLVKAAVGAALSKAQEGVKAEMAAVTGGMNIPGLGDMLGGGNS
jgi:DNA-binding protein YbaB